MENRSRFPGLYVPQSARVVKNDDEAISQLSNLDFDPRKTVSITDDLGLPKTMQGTASVRYETPTRTRLDVEMQTAGLGACATAGTPAGARSSTAGRVPLTASI